MTKSETIELQKKIEKLEKEIEEKVKIRSKPVRSRGDYRINLPRVRELAQKLRDFEDQPDVAIIR